MWWVNRPGFPLRAPSTDVTFRNRHFSFAWGPPPIARSRAPRPWSSSSRPRQGGKGALCVSRVRVEEREPDPTVWPEPLVRRRRGRWTSTTGGRASSTGSPCGGPGPRARRATTSSPRRTAGAGGSCGGWSGARAASRRSSSRSARPATCGSPARRGGGAAASSCATPRNGPTSMPSCPSSPGTRRAETCRARSSASRATGRWWAWMEVAGARRS